MSFGPSGQGLKILVPVKHVGALDEDFELEHEAAVDPDYLEWSINEWDEYAVEAATQLRDSVGGEVVVVTVSDGECIEGLVSSLARGVDRAIRVWDTRLMHAGPLAVARVLSGVIERESPDLVLCGVQSSDTAHAATGIAAAGFAALPHVAVACAVGLLEDAEALAVDRELEGGVVEHLRVELPALITVQTGINEPAYVTLRALTAAKAQPIEVLTLADLGIADGPLPGESAPVCRLEVPRAETSAEMLSTDAGQAAAGIAEIIRERCGVQVRATA